jgi:hypothetical protein
MELPKPQDIKNFPSNTPKARIMRIGNNLYVAVLENKVSQSGKVVRSNRTLGKVVNNTFYTMDEYHSLFKRDGSPRIAIKDKKKRTYIRKTPVEELTPIKPRRSTDLPNPSSIENYPHEVEKARIIREAGKLKVVVTKYYRLKGTGRHVYTYLGRIVEGRFYTNEEYKTTFDKFGKRRVLVVSKETK